jgi:hypothetical protein
VGYRNVDGSGRQAQRPGDQHYGAMRIQRVQLWVERIKRELLPKYPNME